MPLRKKSRKNNPSDTSSCKGKRVEDLNSVDRDSTGAFGIIRTLSCTIHPLEKRKPSKECENICSGLTDAGMEKKPELIACNGKVQKSTSDGNSNSREVCSRCNSPPKSSVPSINRMNCPDYLESPSFPAKSPTFKIEDYTPTDFSRATVLAMHPNLQNDFIPIAELSESPKRYRNTSDLAAKDGDSYLTTVPLDALQINTSIMAEEHDYAMNLPSSPLLVAVKSAVDSLNQYEDFDILEQIGVGFFAEVFKVRHKPTGELMVLKRNKKKNRVGLLKEVELLKSLQHPNILHYVGACIHEGQLHPLIEYVNGGTLEDRIMSPDDFPWSLRVHLSLDIAKGMEYLHQYNMLHRDLNSHNVLLRTLSSRYTAVVADFGLAAKTIPTTVKKLKRAMSIVGTPYWMAPEVLHGKLYNETADVFSYGIVLCEVISRLSADPDFIPRTKDYGLDRANFQTLPQVVQNSCPREFMELAFVACRLHPEERPSFTDIKTQLCIIDDMHNLNAFSRENLNCTDDTIKPQPLIRLSMHGERSTSLSHLLDSLAECGCNDLPPSLRNSASTEAITTIV